MKIFSTSGRFNVAGRPYQFRSYLLSPDGSSATVRFAGPDEEEHETVFHFNGTSVEVSSENIELGLRYALYRRILNPRADGVSMNPFFPAE
jgi:hypothetical protein